MNKDVSLNVINHSIQNSILHAMPGGIFIYRADTHDILYANRAAIPSMTSSLPPTKSVFS